MKKTALLMVSLCGFLCGAAQAQVGTKKIPGGDSGEKGGDSGPTLAVESHKFYVGSDYTWARFSVSDSGANSGIPQNDYDTSFVDLRAGYRVLSALGVEAHFGVPVQDANSNGQIRADHYYGVYAVPTATVLGAFELGFPIGYAFSSVSYKAADGSKHDKDLDSLSFGVNAEVPIREFWDKLPDLRLTGGGMVYEHRSGARYYGYHAGLRFDFGF